MTIEQLKYFLTAAETKNFSKAAEKLYIHNATISRGVAALEQEFDTPLFVRNKHSLELTESGLLLQKEGAQLLNHYQAVCSNMRMAAQTVSGSITIVGPSAYTRLLDAPYQRFKNRYPNVTYHVQDCNSGAFDQPYYEVINCAADFGITYSTYLPDPCPDIHVKRLCGERLDMLIPVSHPFFGQDAVLLSELTDSTVLVSEFMGLEFISNVKQLIRPELENTIKTIEMPNDNPILLAAAGYGVSFIPHTLACVGDALNVFNRDNANPSHAAVLDIDTRFDVVLIWRKHFTNPAATLFLSAL